MMKLSPLLEFPFEVIACDTPLVSIRLTSFRWVDTLTVAALAETHCDIPLWNPSGEIPLDPSVRIIRNYPNPAVDGTTFEVDLLEGERCAVTMYDCRGGVVGRVFEGLLDGGRNRLWCDARSLRACTLSGSSPPRLFASYAPFSAALIGRHPI